MVLLHKFNSFQHAPKCIAAKLGCQRDFAKQPMPTVVFNRNLGITGNADNTKPRIIDDQLPVGKCLPKTFFKKALQQVRLKNTALVVE